MVLSLNTPLESLSLLNWLAPVLLLGLMIQNSRQQIPAFTADHTSDLSALALCKDTGDLEMPQGTVAVGKHGAPSGISCLSISRCLGSGKEVCEVERSFVGG